jgi:hypothetical protein
VPIGFASHAAKAGHVALISTGAAELAAGGGCFASTVGDADEPDEPDELPGLPDDAPVPSPPDDEPSVPLPGPSLPPVVTEQAIAETHAMNARTEAERIIEISSRKSPPVAGGVPTLHSPDVPVIHR